MELTDIRCKLCNRLVFHNYKVKGSGEDLTDRWYHCACGCVFNLYTPDKTKVFNEEYRLKFADLKEAKERYDWYIRNYITLIEERTYGRRFLDVGFCNPFMIEEMIRRGWVSTGIDLIKNPYITGNFETHNFNRNRYDFIFLGDVLQCFDDPMEALRKAYNILEPNGLMLIVTPDTDLMRDGKIQDWGHWDLEPNRQFLSMGLLEKMIQRVEPKMNGSLEIILKLNNISQRFINWENMHMLCQKTKIE